ncbi:MAG: hypothetical protein GXP63_05215 [DPANN group archaeon]|nr:hypothetical protein [DPANN group archaeon]
MRKAVMTVMSLFIGVLLVGGVFAGQAVVGENHAGGTAAGILPSVVSIAVQEPAQGYTYKSYDFEMREGDYRKFTSSDEVLMVKVISLISLSSDRGYVAEGIGEHEAGIIGVPVPPLSWKATLRIMHAGKNTRCGRILDEETASDRRSRCGSFETVTVKNGNTLTYGNFALTFKWADVRYHPVPAIEARQGTDIKRVDPAEDKVGYFRVVIRDAPRPVPVPPKPIPPKPRWDDLQKLLEQNNRLLEKNNLLLHDIYGLLKKAYSVILRL